MDFMSTLSAEITVTRLEQKALIINLSAASLH